MTTGGNGVKWAPKVAGKERRERVPSTRGKGEGGAGDFFFGAGGSRVLK